MSNVQPVYSDLRPLTKVTMNANFVCFPGHATRELEQSYFLSPPYLVHDINTLVPFDSKNHATYVGLGWTFTIILGWPWKAETNMFLRLQLKRGLFSYFVTYFLQIYSSFTWFLIEINEIWLRIIKLIDFEWIILDNLFFATLVWGM